MTGLNLPSGENIEILGSCINCTGSASLIATFVLILAGYAFASHFAPAHFREAIALYRENFRPSAQLQQPYVMACVNVVAADTDAEAKRLATSVQQLFKGIITGQRKLLQAPVDNMKDIWSPQEEAAAQQMLRYSFIGGPQKIRNELQQFVASSGVNEVMVTSHIYEHAARIKSYKLFAEVMREIVA